MYILFYFRNRLVTVPIEFNCTCQLCNCSFMIQQSINIRPTPRSTALLKLIVSQLVKKYPNRYGIIRFVAMYTRARHWARWIQSTPSHNIFLRCILILSSVWLGFPSGTSLQDLQPNVWHTFRLLQIISLFIMQVFQTLATSLLLGPNILLSTLLSNTCARAQARRQFYVI